MLQKDAVKILALALLFWSPLGKAVAAQLDLKGGGAQCVTGIDGDVCHHYFGGTEITASFAPAGGDCASLAPRLVQLSTRLEAPLDGAVTDPGKGSCKPRDITVRLPAVTHETEFRLELPGDAKESAGLKAYPKDLLDPLKAWAQDTQHALIVQDKDGKLLDFLDRHEITYSAHAAAPAGAQKIAIVVGDPEKREGERPAAATLYLAETVKDLPLVTVEHTAEGATAVANLKIIDGLSADDPLDEIALVRIFDMLRK